MDDERPPDGPLHWASALVAALLVLTLAVPVLGVAAPWQRAKRPPAPYKLTNSLSGRAVISATNVRPGQAGRGKVTIASTGAKPFRTVKLTQSKASNPFGRSLELQVFDTTTKRCLYPLPRLPKPRPERPAPKPPKRCTAWAPWVGGAKLRGVPVPARRGTNWARKERHVIVVSWRLGPDAPQGTTATFRLDWRATQ